MVGVICKREVCAHPIVTIRCFGWKVFWHVLVAGSNQTFLELVAKYGELAPPQVNVIKLIGRCIRLERRAKRLYKTLAVRWQHHKDINHFLLCLANQEQEHIDLLKVYETLALSSVETGKTSAVSVLRLQIRINELVELKELVNHKYKAEQAFLNGLLNRGPSEEIYLRDELPLPESDFEFESDKLQMHPELLKYDKLYASVEQEELLNQKDKSPMIGLGFDYIPVEKRPDMDFADNGKDIFMPMISLSIPIFNKKYKSSSKQHELMQIEIDASKQNQFNKLQQMMDHAIHGRRAARATYNTQVSNFEHAKNAEEILMKGYESGNLDFIEILDVQELQLKFQLGQIEAIKDYYLQTSVINYLSS